MQVSFVSVAELDKAVSDAGELEGEVEEISKNIASITGSKNKSSMEKFEKVTNKLDKVRAEITKLKVGIKTAER